MSKISAMLDVGKRSLMNSQSALQTVSHNIANKTTEGYSRQRVDLQSNVPIGSGRLRIGMGARAAQVSRVNHEYLEKQILKEGASLGYQESRSNALSRVEEVFNEQTNRGLNKYVADFFNSFRELSVSPENLATRTLVVENSQNLAKDFGRVSQQLKDVEKDINVQIDAQIREVNEMTKEIANLNEKIQSVEISGATANDERDRRELLLKKLAERIDIRYAEDDDGQVNVSTASAALLVSGYDAMEIKMKEVASPEHRGGLESRIFYVPPGEGLTPVDITDQLNEGAVGGALEVRDKVIKNNLDKIDSMAFQLITNVNSIHQQGYDRHDNKGEALFNMKSGPFDIAANMEVNENIVKNVSKIAAAATINSPGDNRVANLISNLQGRAVLDNDRYTLDEFYNGVVGSVGVVADRANSNTESQKNILKQLSKIRDSVSGVSLDEETTKMIEFQKSFDASAKLIQTADEMLQTVLNLKR